MSWFRVKGLRGENKSSIQRHNCATSVPLLPPAPDRVNRDVFMLSEADAETYLESAPDGLRGLVWRGYLRKGVRVHRIAGCDLVQLISWPLRWLWATRGARILAHAVGSLLYRIKDFMQFIYFQYIDLLLWYIFVNYPRRSLWRNHNY